MRNVYTVAQVNAYIKNMFNQDFLLRQITVKGEVSNCRYHSSGHIYFTLKDGAGAIACVMFKGNRQGLKFQMQDGQLIAVTGTIDVYERDGKYQLYAQSIDLDGEGKLYERFEQLKKRLAESGMFAPEYKQPIPKYIHTLGVVTAPTGAAVRDIINVSTRRNPYIQIVLYPAIVQGDQAVASIVKGIEVLSEKAVDVIIVGRGGGSIEDLWAFNEEEVAEAIFNCPIPIISAVGHETDTTIADYVADMRAPTPSAAAELAVFEYNRLMQDIADYEMTLTSFMNRRIRFDRDKVAGLQRNINALSPMSKVRDRRMRAVSYEDAIKNAMDKKLWAARHRLEIGIERMKGLSPLDKLNSGFSYVEDAEGKNVRSIEQIKPGDDLTIQMSDGSASARVVDINKRNE
ncbi:MAG: exodeoxyribonuclease VII large subunit [Butyrivibrio sp.]|nr:exodeoxyribonuclease VII large subunit [Butyrivibrio sp.]